MIRAYSVWSTSKVIFLSLLIIFSLILLSGLVLMTLPVLKSPDYVVNGKVELTSQQWETVKSDLYRDKADLTTVTELDSGQIYLVQFDETIVGTDNLFPFGTVTKVGGKTLEGISIEFILTTFGIIGTALFCVIFINTD